MFPSLWSLLSLFLLIALVCIYKCNLLARDAPIKVGDTKYVQGVLGLHEFWAREELVQAKFVLVKLCTSSKNFMLVKFIVRAIQGMVYTWKFVQVKFVLVKFVQAKDTLYLQTLKKDGFF